MVYEMAFQNILMVGREGRADVVYGVLLRQPLPASTTLFPMAFPLRLPFARGCDTLSCCVSPGFNRPESPMRRDLQHHHR